jgi:hypothetical protein
MRFPPDMFPNPVDILPATTAPLNDPVAPLTRVVARTLPPSTFPTDDTLPAVTLPVAFRDTVLVTPPMAMFDAVDILPALRFEDRVAFTPDNALTSMRLPALILPVPVDTAPAFSIPVSVAAVADTLPVALRFPTWAFEVMDTLPHDTFPVAITDMVLIDCVAITLLPCTFPVATKNPATLVFPIELLPVASVEDCNRLDATTLPHTTFAVPALILLVDRFPVNLPITASIWPDTAKLPMDRLLDSTRLLTVNVFDTDRFDRITFGTIVTRLDVISVHMTPSTDRYRLDTDADIPDPVAAVNE